VGSRGPLPKAGPARRSSHRKKQPEPEPPLATIVALPAPERKEPPAPPRGRGWLRATRSAWADFWTSDGALRIRDEHVPGLVRLFDLRDERERMRRSIKELGRVVQGSKGQPVLNPLIREMRSLEAEIRQSEDRFILTPAAEVRAGAGAGETGFSIEALNEAIANAERDEDEDDPRLAPARKPRRNR
jgi:hypothetical protein